MLYNCQPQVLNYKVEIKQFFTSKIKLTTKSYCRNNYIDTLRLIIYTSYYSNN